MNVPLFDRELIANTWKSDPDNGRANVGVWDDEADAFARHPLPRWDDDLFLLMLSQEADITSTTTAIDVGCGTGRYALALAERMGAVHGVDFSEKMIAHARTAAHERGCDNVSFDVGDFRTMDVAGKYDLAIAHLTPAICDGETLGKLQSLARKQVFIAKPTRKSDSVLDPVMHLLGRERRRKGAGDDILRMFALAWLGGSTPSVRHYRDEWTSTRTFEEACKLYGDQLMNGSLDEDQRALVRSYLSSIAHDGMVEETISTEVVIMGWAV